MVLNSGGISGKCDGYRSNRTIRTIKANSPIEANEQKLLVNSHHSPKKNHKNYNLSNSKFFLEFKKKMYFAYIITKKSFIFFYIIFGCKIISIN